MLSDFTYEVTKRTIESLADIDALRQLTLTLLESNKHQADLINMWIYGDLQNLNKSGRGE